MPVAYEVAGELGAEMDVLAVRKLGLPGHEELAMGAIGAYGALVLNDDIVEKYGVSDEELKTIVARETRELERRLSLYRVGDSPVSLQGRPVLIVDDGLATGATMKAACQVARRQLARSVHVAVPVAAPSACDALRSDADSLVCLSRPDAFFGVGQFYVDFGQTTDEEVLALLELERQRRKESSLDQAT